MAKRRRLTPAIPAAAPETKARFPLGLAPTVSRPPVAQVAAQAADRAALEEILRGVEAARAEGRLAQALPLDAIVCDHLARDRLVLDEEALAGLEASLEASGQRTPIEVVELGGGRYGLISGWRRISALRRLGRANVLAVIRRPETAADAYRAMVEENEIRAGLSYWERAHVAVRAAELGVYPDVAAAIAGLFAHASRARRSKIGSFAALVPALGPSLRFPAAIPERTGLALAAALDREGFAAKLRDALRKAAPGTAEAERAILERALRKRPETPKAARRDIAPGLALESRPGRLVLTGAAVDEALATAIGDWLAARPVP
jgi:ParB family chromosome partitioning protein